jgi:hypothetical protein
MDFEKESTMNSQFYGYVPKLGLWFFENHGYESLTPTS